MRVRLSNTLASVREFLEACVLMCEAYAFMGVVMALSRGREMLAVGIIFIIPAFILAMFLIELGLRKGSETKAKPLLDGFLSNLGGDDWF